MKDYYVRVTTPSYGDARSLFCRAFAEPIMGRPDKWAFQYEADKFEPEYHPLGEFEHLVMG